MSVEIRRPERSEMAAYYLALPFGNGLPSWEPAPAAWYGGSAPWPPPRPPATAEQLDSWAEADADDESFHPVAAFVDGRLAGASAMLSFDLTVPGPRTVRLGGVTSTGVIATHRRRGLLRAMMQAMFTAALDRGEPLAALSASEGGIYGRFGFSPATVRTRWEIERGQAALLPTGAAPEGTVDLLDAESARAVRPLLHERIRRDRVGELSPQPDRSDGLAGLADGAAGPLRHLAHRDRDGQVDGLADFRLPWSDSAAHVGTLVVEALQAATATAYRELWELLLDFDLTRTVVAVSRPTDEPLRWMLANPRAMRVTRQSDNLWLRLLDVPTALASRCYDATTVLTFEILDDPMCPGNEGTWRLETSADGASCVRSTAAPDVTLDLQTLGSLYLGGMSAHLLAEAGRIRAHAPGVVPLISRTFRTDPEPHNSFGF